ncbi:type IV pilus modification protein PilV [Hydrogenophaga aromaticivorans]|uniref:type IV pilus modification protein PilV n=1 Tax=Hydrogenophaga aromaticivorans TaxID=2610898 RepID=UPI001B389EB2|nr:type IV pilus modification protein PilV [Hydrogenophaga aromaticivorans]MBQ0917527.1 type IV pilus modification protein PilV [Hydrogenophaga aromaticivorans]
MSNKRRPPPVRQHPADHSSQRGVGLIEVLVAVLVLAIGLLGIAGLQGRALKNGQSAFERSQAVTLTYLMMDAMRANVGAARAGQYNINRTCSVSAGGTLITNDQRLWMQSLKQTLGDRDATCGEVICQGDRCAIRIYWDDTRGTDGSDNQMVETISVL